MDRKDVLDLDDFSREEIEEVLATAEAMREVLSRPIRRVPPLRGKTIINLFYEPSTRTRISFELAAKNLSADVVNVSASGSSVEKGESLVDTIRTLQALGADVVVMRHPMAGAPYLVAQHLRGSVINAGDGCHAHPTQALLDLFTIRQKFRRIHGLTVLIVGDILYSRVARSNIWGLTRMGARVILCGPPTLMPDFGTNGHRAGLPPVEVCHDLDRCIERADVVMALRIQRERQDGGLLPSLREYVKLYQINRERMLRARPGALVMHPGPMNEGIEIAPDVARGDQSVIEEQVTNGVAVRMALLYLLAGERAGLAVA
ncbi:MAG TPA: aspartate carbamoyltransferase catalytic subunit [Chloroflexota bacterium]|jgi:aspartate carbamoyltransferase catalytic subunit|nr:aspartate carbamoyltransferase catalytic subunit [Chloroflexota bacterium]